MESSSEPKITLRATLDSQKFQAPVSQKIIHASTFLSNIIGKLTLFTCFLSFPIPETCTEDTTLDVNMTSKQLQQFIDFFEHYSSTTSPKDTRFENKFFKNLPDAEFFALCKAVDFFDCDRFTEAAADFVVKKLPGMEKEDMQKYFGIVDDFSEPNIMDYFKN